MKLHSLLMIGLVAAIPSNLFAQPAPAPPEPPAVRAPGAPHLALAATPPAAPMPAEAQTPPAPAAPKAPKAAPGIAGAPAPPAPPRPVGQMINVQIEVTLSDSKGSPKTVMLTVADGETGQNRTTTYVAGAQNGANFAFNADARPTISGNRIRLYLTAEASVPGSPRGSDGAAAPALSLRQSQTLILTDGLSAEIAKASDPVTDRNFVLSVKASILK